jgi:hypothetical protein
MTVPMCVPYHSPVTYDDQAARKRRPPNWLAAIVFFLEVFGLASIAMGGAMVLAAAGRVHEVMPPVVSVAAQGYEDNYLEMFAKGPGRGWYVLGQTPCAADHSCEQP